MNILVLPYVALLAVSGSAPASSQTQATQPQITNFQTPGNLKSDHPLDCIASEQAKNIYTPADLYKAVAKCVSAEKYKDGVFLYALAGSYGRFDALRVADATAHQAVTVLQMQDFDGLDPKKKDLLTAELKRTVADKIEFAALCTKIRGIGPPNYHPDYMIQHGMGTFNGLHGDGLIPNFDAKAAWDNALGTYLHCPNPPG